MSSISNNKSEEVSRMLESYHRLQKYCHQGGKKATKTTPILQNENAEEQKKDTLRVEGKTVPLAIKKKYSFNSSVYSESCERDFFIHKTQLKIILVCSRTIETLTLRAAI